MEASLQGEGQGRKRAKGVESNGQEGTAARRALTGIERVQIVSQALYYYTSDGEGSVVGTGVGTMRCRWGDTGIALGVETVSYLIELVDDYMWMVQGST